MPVSSTIGNVYEYSGSLLALQAGQLLNVSVLNTGSGPLSATIVNDDTTLDQNSDGVATASINGDPAVPLDYIGKGTAATVTLLGIQLFSTPAMAFDAGGKIYIHFPNGLPPLSGLLISFNLNPDLGFPLPNPMPICLAAGTLVATPTGGVPVEWLRPGDLVRTRDHGAQPVRWVGRRRVGPEEQLAEPKLRPIVIPAGALGNGLPHRTLTVSRQHRMLVLGPGQAERLVPAALLDGRQGIRSEVTRRPLMLHHLLFDRHEIILAEGAATESLHLGSEALKALDPEAAAEIDMIGASGGAAALARPVLRRADLRRMDRAAGGQALLVGLGGDSRAQAVATRAVTSISNRMASSISGA